MSAPPIRQPTATPTIAPVVYELALLGGVGVVVAPIAEPVEDDVAVDDEGALEDAEPCWLAEDMDEDIELALEVITARVVGESGT